MGMGHRASPSSPRHAASMGIMGTGSSQGCWASVTAAPLTSCQQTEGNPPSVISIKRVVFSLPRKTPLHQMLGRRSSASALCSAFAECQQRTEPSTEPPAWCVLPAPPYLTLTQPP